MSRDIKNLDRDLKRIDARVRTIESKEQNRVRFALQYVCVPLAVAICAVWGGVWVASTNNSALVERTELTSRQDALALYAEAATLFVSHINDLVNARNQVSSSRLTRLEDLVSQDLAKLAGAIARLKLRFPEVRTHCEDLTAMLAGLTTATIPLVTADSELYLQLSRVRNSAEDTLGRGQAPDGGSQPKL